MEGYSIAIQLIAYTALITAVSSASLAIPPIIVEDARNVAQMLMFANMKLSKLSNAALTPTK